MIQSAKHGRRAGAFACAADQLLGSLAIAAQRTRVVLVDGQPLIDFDAGSVALPAPFRTLEPKW
jgi:hypothetical protein